MSSPVLPGCGLQRGECSFDIYKYWFGEHRAWKADGERRLLLMPSVRHGNFTAPTPGLLLSLLPSPSL